LAAFDFVTKRSNNMGCVASGDQCFHGAGENRPGYSCLFNGEPADINTPYGTSGICVANAEAASLQNAENRVGLYPEEKISQGCADDDAGAIALAASAGFKIGECAEVASACSRYPSLQDVCPVTCRKCLPDAGSNGSDTESTGSASTESCCDLDWQEEGQNFCTMEAFTEESVDTCGMCLFDRQCKGFQEAYDQELAENPNSMMATGLVYCCPDAKRCVDRRSTEENPNGIGCPSGDETADCGYGPPLCGQRLANSPDYPKNCADVGCGNPNFPQLWMETMSCSSVETAKMSDQVIGSYTDPADVVVFALGAVGAITLIAKAFTHCKRKTEYKTVLDKQNVEEI